MSGGGDGSDWVRNLRAEPAVTVRVRDVTYDGRARAIDDADEERRARDMVFAKYQTGYGSDLTEWRERALPIAIEISGRHNVAS